MRLSDFDLDKATIAQYGRWRETINQSKQRDLADLQKFAKDNKIQLTDLDKEMLSKAQELNQHELEQEFHSRMKKFFDANGRNYGVERGIKQHRLEQKRQREQRRKET